MTSSVATTLLIPKAPPLCLLSHSQSLKLFAVSGPLHSLLSWPLHQFPCYFFFIFQLSAETDRPRGHLVQGAFPAHPGYSSPHCHHLNPPNPLFHFCNTITSWNNLCHLCVCLLQLRLWTSSCSQFISITWESVWHITGAQSAFIDEFIGVLSCCILPDPEMGIKY